jgi:hypothetical protein
MGRGFVGLNDMGERKDEDAEITRTENPEIRVLCRYAPRGAWWNLPCCWFTFGVVDEDYGSPDTEMIPSEMAG